VNINESYKYINVLTVAASRGVLIAARDWYRSCGQQLCYSNTFFDQFNENL